MSTGDVLGLTVLIFVLFAFCFLLFVVSYLTMLKTKLNDWHFITSSRSASALLRLLPGFN